MTIACDCSQLTPEKLAEIENKLKPLKELGIAVWYVVTVRWSNTRVTICLAVGIDAEIIVDIVIN